MIAAHLLMLGGAALILLAATGVARFRDVLARMHALSKASTLGLVLVLVGAGIGLGNANDVTFVLLAGGLQVITSPVGANLISRATYRAEGITHRMDGIDELAAARHPEADDPEQRPDPRTATPPTGSERPNRPDRRNDDETRTT